jgi:adenosyl cobinamide kinase/adenosyl cobinamide phosphate guanylyltransferase
MPARSAPQRGVGPGMREDGGVDVPTDQPRRVLVLGGARSGKSAFAQSLLAGVGDVCYVATGPRGDDDPEWRARVERHRRLRPEGWRTVETTDLAEVLEASRAPLLIDCLTLWLTAVLDEAGAWEQRAGYGAAVQRRVDALVGAWRDRRSTAVAVSNEVGWGVVPDTWSGRLFRDQLGLLNQSLAREADEVWLLIAGIPQRLG